MSSQAASASRRIIQPHSHTTGWKKNSISASRWMSSTRLSQRRAWASSWVMTSLSWTRVSAAAMLSGSRMTGRKTPASTGPWHTVVVATETRRRM